MKKVLFLSPVVSSRVASLGSFCWLLRLGHLLWLHSCGLPPTIPQSLTVIHAHSRLQHQEQGLAPSRHHYTANTQHIVGIICSMNTHVFLHDTRLPPRELDTLQRSPLGHSRWNWKTSSSFLSVLPWFCLSASFWARPLRSLQLSWGDKM